MGFSLFLIKQLCLLLVLPFSILYLRKYATAAQFDPSQYPRQERCALYALKASFNNSFLNDNWTGPQCSTDNSSGWHGIRCVSGLVSEISLESIGLNATLIDTDAFLFLTELTVLSFKNNSISGNVMNFSSNIKMKRLDLSGNKLYGSIPRSLLSLTLLESLLLQDNYLKGSIPEFNQSSLTVFNVSNNDLNGSIPTTQTLQSFGPDSYSSNRRLFGPPTLNTCNSIFTAKYVADVPSNENSPPEPPKKSSKPNFATTFIVFDVVGLVAVIFLFLLYFQKVRKRKKMIKKDDGKEKEGGRDTTCGDDRLEDEGKGKGCHNRRRKREAYVHRGRSKKFPTE
ncbi:unnamed protein product [Dovyalis caffra]|uniref:Leucine-rich repeat-containing N-terminal plant-type domain-containing protein n=1 Tax=Dovyalis caffra TaxID=77055 RepID=A0AAV1SSJ8_9ROSI|nr:unnamed protein product [Dovyalis caffra]